MKKLKYFRSVMLIIGFIVTILVVTSSFSHTSNSVSTNTPAIKTTEITVAGNDANDVNFIVTAANINLEEVRLG